MTKYYKDRRDCGLNCLDWIDDEKRVSWKLFCQRQFLQFGFSKKLVLQIFEEVTMDKTIKDGQIKKVKS